MRLRTRVILLLLAVVALLGVYYACMVHEGQLRGYERPRVGTTSGASCERAVAGGVVSRAVSAQAGVAAAPDPAPVASGKFLQRCVVDAQRLRGVDGAMRDVEVWEADFKYPLVRVESREGGRRAMMVADHLLVRVAAGCSYEDVARYAVAEGWTVRRQQHVPEHYLIATDAGADADLPGMLDRLSSLAWVDVVEPDIIFEACEWIPNDPGLSGLWHLHRIGAYDAWDITTGKATAAIAVIDSGIDFSHPDLLPNRWTNTREIPSNGIDDDGNGYVDDRHGWDFYAGDPDGEDGYTHGTHVAGIAAARGNNGYGVVGVDWYVKLMNLRFLDHQGSGVLSDALDAMRYAMDMAERDGEVKAVNASWGSSEYSSLLATSIARGEELEVLVSAAAGNSGLNVDIYPYYPACFNSLNLITVANAGFDDGLSSHSNWGLEAVDLAAPGMEIVSCAPGGGTSKKSGTSMSAPQVTGAATLLWSMVPSLTLLEVRELLLGQVEPIGQLTSKVVSGGLLDLEGVLRGVHLHVEHDYVGDQLAGAGVAVVVRATPRELLGSNGADAVELRWYQEDGVEGTSAVQQVWMPEVSDGLYRVELQTPAVGTRMYYQISAHGVNGAGVDLPADLPGWEGEWYQFDVRPEQLLTVLGAPSEHGTVTPAYGEHRMVEGKVQLLSAPRATDVVDGLRYGCRGWLGSGSVPPEGTDVEVSVSLTETSSITWLWQEEAELSQRLPWVVDGFTRSWWQVGSTARSVGVPDLWESDGGRKRFAAWTRDGVIMPHVWEDGLFFAAGILMSRPQLVEVIYLPEEEDLDHDKLADWWELRYLGSRMGHSVHDPDGDGARNGDEFADGTDPTDPEDVPRPPVVTLLPAEGPEPGSVPGPWRIAAIVEDNWQVAHVRLLWSRNGASWVSSPMSATGGVDRFEGVFGGGDAQLTHYAYRVEAEDGGGNIAVSPVYEVTVSYPVLTVEPGSISVTSAPVDHLALYLSLRNAGSSPLMWRRIPVWSDDAEGGTDGWEHSGINDRWHISSLRSYEGEHAWFCGWPKGGYSDNMDARLISPTLRLGGGSRLQFMQWCDFEYDEEQMDDHYWDGAIVEVSTNGGDRFEQIFPEGGYPGRITANPASPFAPDTPCFGTTDGWEPVVFDLAAYAGCSNVLLRFRFGSDGYVTGEGWYIDDVRVVDADGGEEWLTLTPSEGTRAGAAPLLLSLRAELADLPTGRRSGWVLLRSNDPVTPDTWVPVHVRINSVPLIEHVGGAQVSTNGEGIVAAFLSFDDQDGDVCSAFVEWSCDGGVQWEPVNPIGVSGGGGESGVASAADLTLTNLVPQAAVGAPFDLQIDWETQALVPGTASALVRCVLSDGLGESAPVTSAVFLVDNEAPTTPVGLQLDVVPNAGGWVTDASIGAHWVPSSDASGSIVYRVVAAPDGWQGGVGSVAYAGGLPRATLTLPDGGAVWVGVQARDPFGNESAWALSGPWHIDGRAPSVDGAWIKLADGGAYTFETSVPVVWGGFADGGSGLAGYQVATEPEAPTVYGAATQETLLAGVLAGEQRVSVRAVDGVGHVSAPIYAQIVVLDEAGDHDADGMPNGLERDSGVDPLSRRSMFALEATARADGVLLQLPTTAGFLYQVERSVDGTLTGWEAVGEPHAGDGGDLALELSGVEPCGFYRVRVWAQP